jgi:hypothetical protein
MASLMLGGEYIVDDCRSAFYSTYLALALLLYSS